MALIALLWHHTVERRNLLMTVAGQTGEKGGLTVESLCFTSRFCAAPLLAIGGIIFGLQKKMRRVKTDAAVGQVALREV